MIFFTKFVIFIVFTAIFRSKFWVFREKYINLSKFWKIHENFGKILKIFLIKNFSKNNFFLTTRV